MAYFRFMNAKWKKRLKAAGWLGFLFFLIKGLAWLAFLAWVAFETASNS